MTLDLAFAFVVYAVVTSITPGPNNTILMVSGANYGFRRSVPAMLGVVLGFAVMLLAVALGLGGIFTLYPALHDVLRYLGAAYLLYLAWRIATAVPKDNGGEAAPPPGFFQMAGFQWVNPKAWIVAVGAAAAYLPAGTAVLNGMALTLVYTIGALPSVLLWTLFGTLLRRVLSRPRARRVFNIVMALLLVASLYPILFQS